MNCTTGVLSDRSPHGTLIASMNVEQAWSVEVPEMIVVSEEAIAAVKRAMDQAGQIEGGLRILVKEGGCAGYQYIVDLDREQRSDDIVVEAGGVRLFIDPASRPWLEGMTLWHKQGLEGSGFTFENPNANSTCGCKKSFS
jgi:iron-sulfur cluster assembly protein